MKHGMSGSVRGVLVSDTHPTCTRKIFEVSGYRGLQLLTECKIFGCVRVTCHIVGQTFPRGLSL